MFRCMTRAIRWRAAAISALAYGLCVVVPPVALAFVTNAEALHYLTKRHQHYSAATGLDSLAIHVGHSVHNHDANAGLADHGHSDLGQSSSGEQGTTVNCCGYFCLSAVAAPPLPSCEPQARILPSTAQPVQSLMGRDPGRVDRPPRPLPLS